jgi:hypothetical protein
MDETPDVRVDTGIDESSGDFDLGLGDGPQPEPEVMPE